MPKGARLFYWAAGRNIPAALPGSVANGNSRYYIIHNVKNSGCADNMLSLELSSPADICRSVAARARAARLTADLSQEGLAERAGVSLGTLKRFERTGAASLEVVARIALALRLESGFEGLFIPPKYTSLEEVIAAPRKRQRGQKK